MAAEPFDQASPRTTPSRWAVALWLLGVPVVAMAVMAWLGMGSDPIVGEVVESTMRSSGDGIVANVRWTDEDGIQRWRRLEIRTEHRTTGTVLLRGEGDRVVVVEGTDPEGSSAGVLVVTGLIGLALAVVALATVRGFGYVRGTGLAGEMTPGEVRESRGFYWRH